MRARRRSGRSACARRRRCTRRGGRSQACASAPPTRSAFALRATAGSTSPQGGGDSKARACVARLLFPNVGIRPRLVGIFGASKSQPIRERTAMKATLLAGIALSCALATAAWAAVPNYHVVDKIKVGDGGFDYAVFDTAKNRVLMARTNYTTAIDAKTGKVSELKTASAGHMAMPIPGTSMLLLPRGRGTIAIVDEKTDQLLADLKGGMNPDGAAYDPFSKMVFVMNHGSGESTVVDPVAKKVVATIDVGGELEFPASDGAGKVFVNVEDK